MHQSVTNDNIRISYAAIDILGTDIYFMDNLFITEQIEMLQKDNRESCIFK